MFSLSVLLKKYYNVYKYKCTRGIPFGQCQCQESRIQVHISPSSPHIKLFHILYIYIFFVITRDMRKGLMSFNGRFNYPQNTWGGITLWLFLGGFDSWELGSRVFQLPFNFIALYFIQTHLELVEYKQNRYIEIKPGFKFSCKFQIRVYLIKKSNKTLKPNPCTSWRFCMNTHLER